MDDTSPNVTKKSIGHSVIQARNGKFTILFCGTDLIKIYFGNTLYVF